MNKISNEFLDELLEMISYIRTHTEEQNVLAELNIMETKIIAYKENLNESYI